MRRRTRNSPRLAGGLAPMASSKQGLLRTCAEMAAPYRWRLVAAFFVQIGTLATMLSGPILVEYAINHGLVHNHSMRVVDVAGLAYLLVAAASLFLTRAQTQLLSGTGELILNDLRKHVFRHLLAQPLGFFETESSGQLLSRMTADIDVLETLVQNGLGTLVTSVGLFVFSIVILVAISPLMFVVTAVSLVPVLIASAHYRTASTRAYRAVRERIGDTLASIDEGLAGVRVIQAFRRKSEVTASFDGRNADQLASELLTVRLSSRFFPKVEGSGVFATAMILLAGAGLMELHLTSIGVVAAYVLYVANLFNSIQSLSQLFDLLQSSGAALSTVVALLQTEPAMVDPAVPAPLPHQGTLELRNVSFTYHERPSDLGAGDSNGLEVGEPELVLRDVNLAIGTGRHLALVGPTGAGKSTLAKLVGRLYDPTRGSVRLGGVDLRRASLRHLRERIVIVPQEGFLFRGTVLDNILVGRREATEDDVLRVLHRLGLDGWVASLPDGLQTDVGERGSHLSAGERQLVSLIRAALTDPAVLVMDEATSSVDPGTEAALERALAAIMRGRTTITIAHRLTTAKRADLVAVVDGGGLVEVGRHRDLVAVGGAYSQLFAAWEGRDH